MAVEIRRFISVTPDRVSFGYRGCDRLNGCCQKPA
eukprot:gene18519-26154_t